MRLLWRKSLSSVEENSQIEYAGAYRMPVGPSVAAETKSAPKHRSYYMQLLEHVTPKLVRLLTREAECYRRRSKDSIRRL